MGDINYDGVVDFDDYGIVAGNYGQTLPPEFVAPGACWRTGAVGGGQVVPEPGTFALLAAGLLGLIAYAWRKRK